MKRFLLATAFLAGITPYSSAQTYQYLPAYDLSNDTVIPTGGVPTPLSTVAATANAAVPTSTLGQPNGPAVLDASGALPSVRLMVTNPVTYGNFNTAVAASAVANSNHAAQVMGWTTPSGIASYASRDSVAQYIDNVAPPPVATVSGTFTGTTFVPTTALSGSVVAALKVGMIIDTTDSTKYSGTITGWASNGSSITVSGWFQMGNVAAGQVPSGPSAIINPITKIWAINANVILNGASYATSSAGFELGTIDNSPTAATNTSWGFDSVNLGSNTSQVAFISRGDWHTGFMTYAGRDAGFWYLPQGGYPVGTGFRTEQLTGTAFRANPQGRGITFAVDAATGAVDIGGQTTVTPNANLNFHSSAGSQTYDVRIGVSGGTGTASGTGYLSGVSLLTCLSAISGCGNEALRINRAATQTNRVDVTGAAAGSGPTVAAAGGDTNVPLIISSKGTGEVMIGNGVGNIVVGTGTGLTCLGATSDCGNEAFRVSPTTSQANRVNVKGAVAGSGPTITADGSDTNVPLNLSGKGTGEVVIGNGTGMVVGTGITCIGATSDCGNEAARFVPVASTVNRVNVTGAATGGSPVVAAAGGDGNIPLSVLGKGNFGVLTGMFIATVDPTTANIPAGQCADWNNTVAATIKHVCNVAGTLRSVVMN